MKWWKRRKRSNYPLWRKLREGDIVWKTDGPILLVQRIHRKEYRSYSGMIYWYDGVFLSLMTGKIHTQKLSNGMTFADVTFAPKPSPPEDESDDEDESNEVV